MKTTLALILKILVLSATILSAEKTKITFVTGDEEYRSEESMPMLAQILKRDYGFDVSIAYSLDEKGFVNPNKAENVTGIETLAKADLLVLFTRFRRWPEEKFEYFLDHVAKGKPIVGFRTATHAFRYPEGHKHEAWNNEKIAELVGQKWITHHGHHGSQVLTKAKPIGAAKGHPILRGVKPFDAYSWLYHVQGGEDKLHGDSIPLVEGTALKSKHLRAKNTKKYPLTGPTAWVKTYRGKNGAKGRVFFSTTAHSFDFREAANRKLSLNGILWALGMEKKIPANGCNPTLASKYEPNDAGFGEKFKKGLKPIYLRK